MDAELLKAVGQIAGIGGLALGVFLLLFRDIIRKTIFPQLTRRDGYRLLRLTAVLVFLIAALGLLAWVWTETGSTVVVGDKIDTDCSAVNTGSTSNANVSVACSNGRPAK